MARRRKAEYFRLFLCFTCSLGILVIPLHYLNVLHFPTVTSIGLKVGNVKHGTSLLIDEYQPTSDLKNADSNEVTEDVRTVNEEVEVGNEFIKSGKEAQELGDTEVTTHKPSFYWKTNTTRYLLPLFQYGDGPSGLYIHVRFAVIASLFQHRTLIIPYLHKHFTQKTGPMERTANETFDIDKLSEVINVGTLDDFKRECGSHFTLENITHGPFPKGSSIEFKLEEYETIRGQCDRIMGVTMPDVSEAPDLLENVAERFKSMLPVRCLGYVTPRNQIFHNEEIDEKVAKFFFRAPYIRRMADEVMGKLCEGSFAVMHWRNKSGEHCRAGGEPWTYRRACTETVKEGLALLSEQVDTIIDLVWDTLREHDISCLYVCTAPYEQKMVDHLKKSERVYTLEDSIEMSDELSKYKNDNYVLSLVEQEIAEQTQLLISCFGSQWSRFVGYVRTRNKLKTIPLREITGIPKHLLSYTYLL
ncbi:uncharacterized protein [Ptychodera flava]|uniref:uncharacterized protein n=1 Tax=Ptychodera flava TaxID=63121 RepID=UPI00396A847C